MTLTLGEMLTLADIADESRRLVMAAGSQNEVLRIAGGVAFQLRVAGRVDLPRPPLNDIDIVVSGGTERRMAALLASLGYEGEKGFNARYGATRLLFWDRGRNRKLDVFVGAFVMCHRLPIAERLGLEPETIPLAELLLTKLQIVQLNEKDVCDMHMLLITHDLGRNDGETINADHIAEICAKDWGLHHTVSKTLERLKGDPPSYTLNRDQRATVNQRIAALQRALDDRPKSIAWRTRASIGERIRWYEEPEEI